MKNITLHQFIGSLRYGNAANPTAADVARRARFLERYPSQEANILSYQTDPKCKCGRDILAAITNDADKVENLSYVEGEPINIIVPIQAVGKIIVIDDDEAAYLALTQRFQAEMFMFRGLSIVPTTIDGAAKLRVFFY